MTRTDTNAKRLRRAEAMLSGPVTGTLAVVTHGLVCAALLRNHLDATSHKAGTGRLYPFRNASLTRIESSPPWRVELLNCAAHLDTLGNDTSIYGQA